MAVVLSVIVVLTSIALAAGLTWMRVERSGRARRIPRADAIVVFGAEVTPAGPSRELQARLEHAASLFHEQRAATILCSGGWSGSICEPAAMQAALLSDGVPYTSIIVDEDGASTRQTVAAARRHGAHTWNRILLVSSPYHMHRILRETRRQRVRGGIPCPAPTTPIMSSRPHRLRQTLREVAAVWWYALSAPRRQSGEPAPARSGSRGASTASEPGFSGATET